MMTKLLNKCFEIVNKEIDGKYQKEAKKILELTSDMYRQQFINSYNLNRGNISCLILDRAKYDLVQDGKMVQKTDDGFGDIGQFD